MRNELHYIDESKHLKRRKEIYEELHPETRVGMRNGQTSKKTEPDFLDTPSLSKCGFRILRNPITYKKNHNGRIKFTR